MVVHVCKLCNKKFTRKSTYDYHINRKNKCNPSTSRDDSTMTDVSLNK
jgi:hypothetical protein